GRVQCREKRGVVDQEDLRKRRSALQTDLLADVEALRLPDVAEWPPQTRAVGERDLAPARARTHRCRPALGAATVEIGTGERAGHGSRLGETDVSAQETR